MSTTAHTDAHVHDRISGAFAHLVRRRRHERGLSDWELSALTAISPSRIHYIEAGHARRLPPPRALQALAAALDLDVGELVTAAFAVTAADDTEAG